MIEGCKPQGEDNQARPDEPNSTPPRWKLRPFPIAAILSTFVTVVVVGTLNFGLKSCLGLNPTKPKYYNTPPPNTPGPPILQGAQVEAKRSQDPRTRKFTIGAGGKKRDLSIRVPEGWSVLKLPDRPATEVLLISKEGPVDESAMIGLAAVNTESTGTLDVWTIVPEESVRIAKRNNPGKNPKLIGAGKLILAGEHAMWMTTDYIEEGDEVCNKNYLIWSSSLMITIGLKTGGPRRAAVLAANEAVFEETVKSFTFASSATD